MVAGRAGPRGVHVPRSVEVDIKFGRDHVTHLCLNMAVLNAREAITKLSRVTHNVALVTVVYFLNY